MKRPTTPALRDRNRAERLFGFYYRIEIFVPTALRKYEYYVFPVLEEATVLDRVARFAGCERVVLADRWVRR